jgi:hypothetical protein
MRKPRSMRGLEDFGRTRLSPNFFMRDFLHSEIANFYGVPNIPDNPDLAISSGMHLCQELLEPLQRKFGRLAIRSGYRSAAVTEFGNARGHGACIEMNAAYHIWDLRDAEGKIGAAEGRGVAWTHDARWRWATPSRQRRMRLPVPVILKGGHPLHPHFCRASPLTSQSALLSTSTSRSA